MLGHDRFQLQRDDEFTTLHISFENIGLWEAMGCFHLETPRDYGFRGVLWCVSLAGDGSWGTGKLKRWKAEKLGS